MRELIGRFLKRNFAYKYSDGSAHRNYSFYIKALGFAWDRIISNFSQDYALAAELQSGNKFVDALVMGSRRALDPILPSFHVTTQNLQRRKSGEPVPVVFSFKIPHYPQPGNKTANMAAIKRLEEISRFKFVDEISENNGEGHKINLCFVKEVGFYRMLSLRQLAWAAVPLIKQVKFNETEISAIIKALSAPPLIDKTNPADFHILETHRSLAKVVELRKSDVGEKYGR